MRIINGETRWYDKDEVQEGGRTARLILPIGREDACTDKQVGKRLIRRFRVRKGDCSAQEAAQYAARLSDAPARAMQVYDKMPMDRRWPGETILTSYLVNIQPGAPQSADRLIPDQHNSLPAPNSKVRGRSPGFSLCIQPSKFGEMLHVEVRVDPDNPADQGKLVAVCDPIPFPRGPHHISRTIRFGPQGMARVEVDGRLICDYAGPLGYSDHAFACWSFGIYRSPWCPGGEEVAAHYEDWREGVVPQPPRSS